MNRSPCLAWLGGRGDGASPLPPGSREVTKMEIRRSLVVNATALETRIALLENGQLCELFIERTASRSQVGDVYKGRVAKLLPGMQSAFVAIGGAKDGFLYLDDPLGPRLEADAADESEGGEEEAAELPPPP